MYFGETLPWLPHLVGAILGFSLLRTVLGRAGGFLLSLLARHFGIQLQLASALPFLPLSAKGLVVRVPLGVLRVASVSITSHVLDYAWSLGRSRLLSVEASGVSFTCYLKDTAMSGAGGSEMVRATRAPHTLEEVSIPRWLGQVLLSTELCVKRIEIKLLSKQISHALVYRQPKMVLASSREVDDQLPDNVQFLTRLSIPQASLSWTFHEEDSEEIIGFSQLQVDLHLQQREGRISLSLGSALEIDVGALRSYSDFSGLERFLRLVDSLPRKDAEKDHVEGPFDASVFLFLQKARLRVGSILGRLRMPAYHFEVTADIDAEGVVAQESVGGALLATIDLSTSIVMDAWPIGLAGVEAQPLARLSGVHTVMVVSYTPSNQSLVLDVKATTTAMAFHVRPEHIAAHSRLVTSTIKTLKARKIQRHSALAISPQKRSLTRLNLAASLNSVVASLHSARNTPAALCFRFDTPSATIFGVIGGVITCEVQSSFVGATAYDFITSTLALPLGDDAMSARSFSMRLKHGPRGSILDLDISLKTLAFQISPEVVEAVLPVADEVVEALHLLSVISAGETRRVSIRRRRDSVLVSPERQSSFSLAVSGSTELHIIDKMSNQGTEAVFFSLVNEDFSVSVGGLNGVQLSLQNTLVSRVRVRPDRQRQFPAFLTLTSVQMSGSSALELGQLSLSWDCELHLQALEMVIRFTHLYRDFQDIRQAIPPSVADSPPRQRGPTETLMSISMESISLDFFYSRAARVKLTSQRVHADPSQRRVDIEHLQGLAGPQRSPILVVPHLGVTAEPREGADVALQLIVEDGRWTLEPAFDFGFLMDELLTVNKAIVMETIRLLSEMQSSSFEKPAATSISPRIVLEANVTDARFELQEGEFQRHLRAAFGVHTDEVAERALRFELLERRLREMSRSGNMTDELMQKIRAQLTESKTRLYCQRVKAAIENAPTSAFSITTPELRLMVAFDLNEQELVSRLRALNDISPFFPADFSYEFDLLAGMAMDLRASRVRLQYRDLPYAWVLASGVHAHGHVVFAEEIPPPESVVHWTVHPSATREIYTTRTATNMKIYHELELLMDQLEYAMGVTYDWAAKEFQYAFVLQVPENIDTHQMCWWDKMRYMFHGTLSIRTRQLIWRVMRTLNPYDKDEHLSLIGREALWSYRTNEMSLTADELKLKISSQAEAFFNTRNFCLVAGMRWMCKGDANDHMVSPTPSFEGPFVVDASLETQSPSYLDFPLKNRDPFSAYRAQGLAWDLELSFDPLDEETPVISLDSSSIGWFQKFGTTMSFPEMYLRPLIYRPSHPGFFTPKFRECKLRVKCRNLSAVYFESRDVHDPSGIKVQVDYLDLSTGFKKDDHKGWLMCHGPFHARGLQALIYPPEDYARFYEKQAPDDTSRFQGTLLMSAPALSLVQDENAVQHFTVHGLRLAINPPVARLLAHWKNAYSQYQIRSLATRGQHRGAPSPDAKQASPSAMSREAQRASFRAGPSTASAVHGIQLVLDGDEFMRRFSGKTKYLIEVVDAQVKMITLDPEGAVAVVADSLELYWGTNAVEQTLLLIMWREYEMYCSSLVNVWVESNGGEEQRDTNELSRILTKGSMQFQIVSSSEDLVRNNMAEAKGVMNLVAPSVLCHMNAAQFNIMESVFSKFLLDQNSSSEHHEEMLATVMFKLQLSPESIGDINALRSWVKRMRNEIKDMRSKVMDLEMEKEQSAERLDLSHRQLWQKQREYQAALELLSLLSEGSGMLRKEHRVLPTWKLNILVQQAHWHMLENERNSLFCEVMLKNLSSSTLIREDASGLMRVEVNKVSIMNHMRSATGKYLHTLEPLRASKWSDRDIMLRVFASKRRPVGGITLYDHFEVNISPLRVNLTDDIYGAVYSYIFSHSEEHKRIAPELKSDMLISRPIKTPGASLMRNFSDFYISEGGEVAFSYDSTPYQVMRSRSELYKMFIYVKITDVPVIVTFHKGVTFKNLKVSLHALEYRVNVWSWEDMTQQVKREVLLDLLSQSGSLIKHALSFRSKRRSEIELEEDVAVQSKSKLDLRLSELSRASRAVVQRVTRGRIGAGPSRREATVSLHSDDAERVKLRLERAVREEELEIQQQDFEEELANLKRQLLFGQSAADSGVRPRSRTRVAPVLLRHALSVNDINMESGSSGGEAESGTSGGKGKEEEMNYSF